MKDLGERHMTDDNSFLRQTFDKNLGITPDKLEESSKILGKDLCVRAHSRGTPLDDYLKGRLHRLNSMA